ncbi:MAG: aldose epimerase family protein, partial [Bacillota bacterium]
MEVIKYGTLPNGDIVSQIIIKNSKNTEARIITYGGAVTHLFVNDKNGQLVDVVLGYDSLEDYIRSSSYCGVIVGRHANRIKNASLIIDGTEYRVTANEGENSLHSGPMGFDRKNFSYQVIDEHSVKLYATSPDGEEGFPGNLDLEVIYELDEDNRLIMNYRAITDKATVVNITNHAYFNLNGYDSGSAMGHLLMIQSDKITENDVKSVPTGNFIPVAGTPFDFTLERAIGERIGDDHQ